MFRRKKSVRHAPLNANPSPSAQTAAVQAFRASQNSTPSLSASAAAAALRSHTPPPTAVRDVQTKRMLQRKLSASSISSSKANPRPDGKNGALRRTHSSGSMSCRTFRDQSPTGTSSPASRLDDMIPVPPLPRGYTASPTLAQKRNERTEAGHRAISPPIAEHRARSISNSSSGFADLERHGSRGSINFSYPMNRPNSPRLSIASADSPRKKGPSSPRLDQVGNSRRRPMSMIERPTSGMVDQGTQIEEDVLGKPPAPKPTPEIGSEKHGKTQTAESVTKRMVDRYPTITGETTAGGDSRKPGSPGLPALARRPSTVLETQEEDHHEPPHTRSLSTANEDAHRKFQANQPEYSELNGNGKEAESRAEQSKKGNRETSRSRPQGSTTPIPQSTSHERPHSLSPTRLTRFSEQLEIPESRKHPHNPPPRSLSPTKPALKSPSSSPLSSNRPERHSFQWGKAGSETSDGTSLISDDGSRAGWKKKHAKVSFEDEAEVIGHAPSPPTSPESPTKPRGDDAKEFDQLFAPRPTLPSFGSVRGRKSSNWSDIETGSGDVAPTSADHAIGGIISAHGTKDTESSPRLSHEVTPLEGAGYSSLSEDSSSADDADPRYFAPSVDVMNISASRKAPDQQIHTEPDDGGSRSSPTPAIFVQPATPGMEEVEYCNGSSPHDTLDNGISAKKQSLAAKDVNLTVVEAEDEDTDSGNSVYSDAYEDLSDIDGDGFGSIDAIIDRPMTSTTTYSQFPKRSQERRKSIEQDDVEASRVTEALPRSQEQYSNDKSSAFHQHSADSEHHTKKPSIQQSNDPPKTSLRKLFEEDPVNPPNPAHPSSSNVASFTQFDRRSPTLQPIQESTSAARPKPILKKADNTQQQRPRRTMSNGSDSSSSFKRPRRFRTGGRYSLRRTMRAGSPSNSMEILSDGGLPPKAFDYSLNHRPFSSNDSRPMMRTTLRQTPTSSRFTALTGQSKTPKTKNQAGTSHRPRADRGFRSRFEDSSEDETETIKLRPVRGIPRKKNEIEGDSTDLDDSSDYDNTTSHVLRRKRSNRGNAKSNEEPAIAAAMAKIIAAKDIENATSIANSQREAADHNARQKGSLLSRLHLTKHKPRRGESVIRKSELESAARRDTPLERSKLELEQLKNASTVPPHPFSGTTTTTSINGRVLEPSLGNWQSTTPKLQKRLSRMPHRSIADSWPLRNNGNTSLADKKRPTVIPLQDLSNAKDPHRPSTSDGVVVGENIEPPASPRSEKAAWTSRFRSSRRGDDTAPAVSALSLPSKREKKGRFPMLKKAFGIS